jgi:hypothetical protein
MTTTTTNANEYRLPTYMEELLQADVLPLDIVEAAVVNGETGNYTPFELNTLNCFLDDGDYLPMMDLGFEVSRVKPKPVRIIKTTVRIQITKKPRGLLTNGVAFFKDCHSSIKTDKGNGIRGRQIVIRNPCYRLTKKGGRCSNFAINGRKFCNSHK